MMFALFSGSAILIIALVIWKESTDKTWRVLSESFSVPWKAHDWANNDPIHIWLAGDNKRTWINALHISVDIAGIGFHPPWFKRWYFSSVEIPWTEIRISDAIPELREKLVLEVFNQRLFLAIPRNNTASIESSIQTGAAK